MTREFSFRDILLVKRLQDKGSQFDLEGAILESWRPLTAALRATVPFTWSHVNTYVLNSRQRELEGFVQTRERPSGVECDIVYLAPALDGSESAEKTWGWLLDDVCVLEGECGVQRLFAKVLVDRSDEMEAFQRAGFSVFAREEIMHLRSLPEDLSTSQMNTEGIRRQRSSDSWWLERLYNHTAPPFVRQIEGLAEQSWESASIGFNGRFRDRQYVLEVKDEVVGHLQLVTGRRGHWMKLLIHPDVQDRTDDLLGWGLAQLTRFPARPLYCPVRSYEVGSTAALQRAGFKHYVKRSLMVRHTTGRVKEPIKQLVTSFKEGAPAAPTASRVQEATE